MSASNVSALEKFPDFADNIVRDWSMANRSRITWRQVLLILFGARRAVSAFGSEELHLELIALTDLADHHRRSEA